MDNRKNDKLKDLLEQFFSSEKAQIYFDDIHQGERILRENPAPEPDDMLIANIKAEIALNVLPRRTTTIKRIVFRVAAVAAAVIIITTISINMFQTPHKNGHGTNVNTASTLPKLSAAFWNNEDIAAYDTEIDQIETEMLALQLGEENIESNRDSTLTEMEMETIVLAGDFWKG
ncbi:MAG: hypothetical protein JW715_03055 [Sedimentisphaerales bacterium]|nr:hypothetical protein [Sedimentisphaerales bacterium]